MALTNDDIKKLENSLLPKFEKSLLPKIGKMIDEKNAAQTAEIKAYIHEGVNAVVDGVDNLLQDKDYDNRIRRLEKIHPDYSHA